MQWTSLLPITVHSRIGFRGGCKETNFFFLVVHALSAVHSTSCISNIKSHAFKELATTKETEDDKVLLNYSLLQVFTIILFHSYSMEIVLRFPDNWKKISDQHKATNS